MPSPAAATMAPLSSTRTFPATFALNTEATARIEPRQDSRRVLPELLRFAPELIAPSATTGRCPALTQK